MLEHVSLFSSLSQGQIGELETIAQKRTIPKNSIVINEGDDSDCLYIVLTGRAFAMRNDESGRQLIINRFGQYDYFGEMSFFDGEIRCATVMTKERCTLMTIQRSDFQGFAARHPQIYWNVINALLAKLRTATQQIEELAFLDVYGRLSRFLVESQDENGVIKEKLTQQELADMVGASRETVCRIFNDLADGGYITRQKKNITILKPLPYKF